MRSKSLLLSVAVFLAAATPSIGFDASRAQVGTADVATADDSGSGVGTADITEDSGEVDPGFGVDPDIAEEEEFDPVFGVEPEENEVEVVSEEPESNPCVENTNCDLKILENVEYLSIEASGVYNVITVADGAS